MEGLDEGGRCAGPAAAVLERQADGEQARGARHRWLDRDRQVPAGLPPASQLPGTEVRRRRSQRHAQRVHGPGEDTVEHPPLPDRRSEEHTSEIQSLMRISYAVFSLKKKHTKQTTHRIINIHNKI